MRELTDVQNQILNYISDGDWHGKQCFYRTSIASLSRLKLVKVNDKLGEVKITAAGRKALAK